MVENHFKDLVSVLFLGCLGDFDDCAIRQPTAAADGFFMKKGSSYMTVPSLILFVLQASFSAEKYSITDTAIKESKIFTFICTCNPSWPASNALATGSAY